MKFIAFITAFIFCLCAEVGFAQNLGGDSKQPIDISADQALEWDRKNGRYIARGNAKLSQGNVTLFADRLIAFYDKTAKQAGSNLTHIEAEGTVRIVTDRVNIYADQGTYMLASQKARLTGQNLRMVSDDRYTLTAKEYFEYDAQNQFIRAVGNATVTQTQGQETLKTSILIARLGEVEPGKTSVKRIEAPNAVTITTQNEKITGNSGTFDVSSNIAKLRGNVQITQGINILVGERAEVNMNTGTSRLFAAEDEKGLPGRVRGVFYPQSQ